MTGQTWGFARVISHLQALAGVMRSNESGPPARRSMPAWLVPDARDRCPDTPALQATDDAGCPIVVRPNRASQAEERGLRARLAGTRQLYNPSCANARDQAREAFLRQYARASWRVRAVNGSNQVSGWSPFVTQGPAPKASRRRSP